MPNLLNTSLTGMLAFQRALLVTSNNIANANTPGYSRQVAEFTQRIGTGLQSNYVGGGTQISTVKRVYDALLGQQLQASTTSQARFESLNALASRIDTLLADPATGLGSGLQSFFNAVQDLANDPGSVPTRQALLGEADGVEARFQSLDRQLGALDGEVNQRLGLAVGNINELAASIANLNSRIVAAGGTNQPPNDLLDARDRQVLALSEQVAITTTIQSDGSMSVFVGSGQSLVVGSEALAMSVRGSEFEPTRLNVFYEGASGGTPLDGSLVGGALGGMLEFRANILDPARQSLGQTAVAFAQQFNSQHASGMDLRGDLGGDFFALDPPAVRNSAFNSGSGLATVDVADLAAYTGENYVLEYDGTTYSLSRAGSGEAVPMTGAGTAGDPFVADGMEIQVAGAPAAGDRLLLVTGQGRASTIKRMISDPLDIAMAAPTRSTAALSNVGDVSVASTRAIDPNDPDLLTPAEIEFLSPTTYSIDGAGSFAYVEGEPIIVNGTELTMSGAPVAGDKISVEPNFGASGDNRNGLLLSGIQAEGVLNGGAVSINENYGRLVGEVGGMTNQIQIGLAAQSVVTRNAEEAMLSNSAVNLDEEAAKLIQYQQSYQAVAQLIGVANTLFQSLLNATAR